MVPPLAHGQRSLSVLLRRGSEARAGRFGGSGFWRASTGKFSRLPKRTDCLLPLPAVRMPRRKVCSSIPSRPVLRNSRCPHERSVIEVAIWIAVMRRAREVETLDAEPDFRSFRYSESAVHTQIDADHARSAQTVAAAGPKRACWAGANVDLSGLTAIFAGPAGLRPGNSDVLSLVLHDLERSSPSGVCCRRPCWQALDRSGPFPRMKQSRGMPRWLAGG